MDDAIADARYSLLSGEESFGAEFLGFWCDETFEITVGEFGVEGTDTVEFHLVIRVVEGFAGIKNADESVHLDGDVEE